MAEERFVGVRRGMTRVGAIGVVLAPAVHTTPPVNGCVTSACGLAIGGNTGSGRVVITYTVGSVAVSAVPKFTG